MTLLEQLHAIQMARTYCLLIGADPDELVAGYILDASGKPWWCRKERWRWYRGVSAPE